MAERQSEQRKDMLKFQKQVFHTAGMMTHSDQTYATTETALNVAFDVSSRSICSSTLHGQYYHECSEYSQD